MRKLIAVRVDKFLIILILNHQQLFICVNIYLKKLTDASDNISYSRFVINEKSAIISWYKQNSKLHYHN